MSTAITHPPSTAPAERQPSAGIDRFTWAVAIGAVLLIVLGVGLAIFLGSREPPPDLETPGGVTLAFETALQRGEADTAWELLSTSAQAATTRQEFMARAAGINAATPIANARFSIENVRVSGDTAHLDLVRVFPQGGLLGLGAGTVTWRNSVTLEREAGAWRISVPPEPSLIMQPPGGQQP